MVGPVRVIRQYWDEQLGTYVAEVERPDDHSEPPPLTLRQKMILAIVRRHYRRAPISNTIATVQRQVGSAWEDECDRRKVERSPAPNRDTVARTLRRASLIE